METIRVTELRRVLGRMAYELRVPYQSFPPMQAGNLPLMRFVATITLSSALNWQASQGNRSNAILSRDGWFFAASGPRLNQTTVKVRQSKFLRLRLTAGRSSVRSHYL